MPDVEKNVYNSDHYSIPKPLKLVLLGSGLLGMFVVKIMRPFVYLRLCLLPSERIGELASCAEMYLRWRADNAFPVREKHVFLSDVPANEQMLKMISRKMKVIRINKYLMWMYQKLVRQFPHSSLWLPEQVCSRKDITNFYPRFNRQGVQLAFLPEEDEQGQRLLREMGVPEGRDFVCVHVRDKAYLNRVHKYKTWEYHDYRDADISTYIPAMKYLTSKGIYVIRMGYLVEEKLDINDPLVIDYANSFRDDLGDIYLSTHCKFFIASEGGLSWVPWAFNIPVAYSNAIPLEVGGKKPTDVFILKKLFSKEKNRILSLEEQFAMGIDRWFRTDQYLQAGLEIMDNSPEEILGMTREMNERLDGVWQTAQEDDAIQRQYLDTLPGYFRCEGLPLPKLSAIFLKMNPQLLN